LPINRNLTLFEYLVRNGRAYLRFFFIESRSAEIRTMLARNDPPSGINIKPRFCVQSRDGSVKHASQELATSSVNILFKQHFRNPVKGMTESV